MPLTKTNQRFLLGLAVLLVLYIFCNSFISYTNAAQFNNGRKIKHIINFIGIGLVYATGGLFLRGSSSPWVMVLWHFVHIIFIVLLLSFGITDWLVGGLPKGIRHFTQTISETLISPVLYVGVGLLRNWLEQ